MTEDEYLTLHKRLRRNYPHQYHYTPDDIAHAYTHDVQLITNTPTTALTHIYSDIANTLTPSRTITLLDIHRHIRRHTNPYAHHGQRDRGLARLNHLDNTPPATPETIRRIRATIPTRNT